MIDLKLRLVEERDQWVVLLGDLVVGRGKTKDHAKYDATWNLREFARRIDWGVLSPKEKT